MADEALSIDQATALLSAPVEVEDEQEAPGEEIQAQDTGSEDASEADEPGDGEEAEEEGEAVEPVPAPAWWSAEKKARFAELPHDLQQIVAEEEGNRERVTSKAKQEAAEARQRADAEAASYAERSNVLQQWLPTAMDVFASRWEGIDWAAWARQDPDAYTAGRAEYEHEQGIIAAAQQEAQRAALEARGRAMQAEAVRLAELVPDLVDEKEGPARKAALSEYLSKAGATADQIGDMNALAISIAWKAHLYDKGREALAAKPKTPPPGLRAISPSGAPQRTSQQRSLEQLNARLTKSGSIDDAVALLQAQRKSG